ncbi:MAG TPA: protein phosphatase 2C domain-containing protein [Steroidobacteraceae bacterium]|nr:protein phosphatase 2C domain-containing protein [Steroidobacteraceae bacterium]
MRVEHAELSLQGARESNQDRVKAEVSGDTALLIACDGMGGHAEGERAAEIAVQVLVQRFRAAPHPLLDPLGFLHLGLGAAHQQIVKYGGEIPMDNRPRATIALCVVQRGGAYWAHVGDSRAYHLRHGQVVARTRDHSHVEVLLREGVIGPEQAQNHPMRNFVESCIGGEALLPEMDLSLRQHLESGDVLLVCTDGLWAGSSDETIAGAFAVAEIPLADALQGLGAQSVAAGGPSCDNTSAVALRFLE